ncbi:tape measure protein [Liquorilactobacillus mali]|uniref:tape measure protein n=3 Tax=Liquorilactobacillus mali TaxID=1618 RepID=UPI0002491FE9|nr:tape measure protein [Liquorilactobacillus mali]EJF00347.1 phage tail tape mesure [Liquorilactobacillus mali KCTC 3596 = DSM 20444]QFQ74581.1 tape measure protein [Liquorilactobacillus mali]
MSTVQNEMATRVALDTISAVNSLKGLKDAVGSATSAWKANATAMSSSGDTLGALQSKVKGIGDVIDLQKQKIAELKTRQEGLDTTTQKGAETYLKLQKQIDSTNNQISSLTSQQDKAKSSMGYYSSGLADLQKGFKNAETANKAYTERLEAEGKQEEANKARVSGLKQSLSNLSEQYNKQESELKRIASESGATSEAYLKQKTRLDETGTAVAKTKTQINELNESMNKKPTGFMSGIKEKLTGVGDEAKHTSKSMSLIKDVFLGNALYSAVSSFTSNIGEMAKSGFEAAESANEVAEKWKNIGISDTSVKQLANTTKDLKENTNLSATAVGNMLTKFYGITGSTTKTEQLAKGVGSLADKLKLSQSQSDAFATGLSKIEASGTVTSSSLARLEKQAPGLSTALAQASGKSQEQFNALVSSGKMTSSQFNDLLNNASKNYKSNSEEFDKSSQGAMHHLQQGWSDTKQALMKPLVSIAGTGLDSLNKALDNPATQNAVTQLGKGIANLSTKAAGIVTFISKHQKDISSITGSVLSIAKAFALGIWNTFKDTLSDISKVFNDLTGNSKKAKDPLNSVSGMLKTIASHKGAIQALGTVFIATFASTKIFNGIKSLETGLAGLTKSLGFTSTAEKILNASMKANIFILIVSAIAAVTVALVELYKHNAKFRAFVNGLIKSAQDAWKNVVKFFKALWKDTVGVVTNLYKDVTGWFGNMKKGIATHVSNTWKNTKNAFSDGWNTTKKLTSDGVGKVGDWFNNMKKTTGNLMASMWKSHKSLFKDGYKVVGDYTSTWHDVMTGKWGKVGGDLKNTLNDLVKFWKNVFKGAYDWINKLTGGRLGDVLNTFKSIFDKIKGVVSGAIKDVHDSFVGITRGIIKPFNDLLGGLEKGINWVLDKVGASKIKGTWSIPLPSYAKGTANTQGTHPGGLAMVNDAKGSKYREMFKLPTGEVGMFPAQRNMIVPLPKGTSVLNGNSSFELAQSLGLPKYASGIGSFFSGLFNKGKDLLEDADKIIAHPMEFLESMFTKFTGSVSSNIGLASDIITNLPKTIASNAVDWVKKLFSDDVGNIKGTATPTQAKDVISKAMGLAGVSGDNWLNGLETIAKYESGFRNVTNNWDSNAKAGHPSSGWFQMIESTFDAYAKKGYTKWTNPLDQAISAIGYIKSRYGGIANVPGIKSLAKGGKYVGYANGGSVSTEGLYTLAEGNKTEYVIPTDYSKHNRAVQLLDDAKRAVTGTGLNDSATEKLDALINLFSNAGDVKINVNIDGSTIAQVVYPKLKLLQAQELTVVGTGTSIKVGG